MELNDIKDLIAQMRKNRIKEIDVEQDGTKLRIVMQSPKRQRRPEQVTIQQMPQPIMMANPPAPGPVLHVPTAETAAAVPEPIAEKTSTEPEISGVEIKAPMVGTCYLAPSPESPPFVKMGEIINEDTVVCIIEAMKLMNEIKAEQRGKVVRILAENGQPVEFGQPLFLIEPY